MSSNFFKAEENDAKYDDVCDIRRKNNRTNTNVIEAFSGLECPGKELHEWESYAKLYKEKFRKAKQCLQRRITTMKRFPARTAENKISRRKHVYPIQVAYSYGKDCLKKIASRLEQDKFENSVNKLIKKVAETQPDVQSYFGNSIEKSIRDRGNTNTIRSILERSYYDKDQLALINKVRNNGYEALNDDDKDLFLSIINEGFARNARPINFEAINEQAASENDEPIETFKREIKKRRKTKKKSMITMAAKPVNLTNLNAILQSNGFKVTDEYRRKQIIDRINKLTALFSEIILINEKIFIVVDIYLETFQKLDKLNRNIIGVTTKLAGISLTKKSFKKVGINEKYLTKIDAFTDRKKLGEDIVKTDTRLREKRAKIAYEIADLLKTGNSAINVPLENFYLHDMNQYTLQSVNSQISSLSEADKARFLEEKNVLHNLVTSVKLLNTELNNAEMALAQNLSRQAKAEEMVKSPKIKESPVLLEKIKEVLRTLKESEDSLEKTVLNKYKAKTETIYSLLQIMNSKYSNPYILKERLEQMNKEKVTLHNFFNKMTKTGY
jgi:hypothetical protein